MKNCMTFVAVLLCMGGFSAISMAETNNVCIPIHAQIEAYFVTDMCGSPVGLCTAGNITQGGLLNGQTSYTASTATPQAGLDGSEDPLTALAYTGELHVITSHGDIIFRDVGVLDQTFGVFSEIDKATEGTGIFADATGTLFIYGNVIGGGTGFSGAISGEICLAR